MTNRIRKNRFRLAVEHLEERTLLSSGKVIDLAAYRFDPTGTVDTGRIIVQFRSDALSRASGALLEGTTLGQAYAFAPGIREVFLDEGVNYLDAVAAYRAHPNVLSADPNYIGQLQLNPNDANWNNAGMYGMRQISAPAAWDYWQGGRYQVAADLDTGIAYNHPDLCQNVWLNYYEIPPSRLANLVDTDGDFNITFADLNNPINQGSGKITDQNGDGRICGSDVLAPMTGATGGWRDNIDNEGNGLTDDLIGWNFGDGNNDPNDTNGHGTHTAGTIGAHGNNSIGVVGVSWRVMVMPLKINPGSSGSITLNAAILSNYYSAWFQVPVSNNSWGGVNATGFGATFVASLNWARRQGQLYVAAAGNSNANNNTANFYPANYGVAGPHGAAIDTVVSVLATNSADNKASFSSYGTLKVHLGAPGEGVLSTCINNFYCSLSGTSMAAPHVTGAAAYLKSLYFNATYLQIKSRILNNVDPRPGMQVITGGRLNLFRSLIAASPGGAPGGMPDQGENPNLENPDGTTAPGVINGNAGLIVGALFDPVLNPVQTPAQPLPTGFADPLTDNPVEALVDLVTDAPVLHVSNPVSASRVDAAFEWNLELGL